MDELRLLRELGRGTPLARLDELAPARARLSAEIASAMTSEQETTMSYSELNHLSSGPDPARAANRRSRRLRYWTAGVTTAAAAAAVVAMVIAGGTGPSGGGESNKRIQVADMSAVKVLEAAASRALQLDGTAPRPDQFLYVKTSLGRYGVEERWTSVDGTRDGLVIHTGSTEVVPTTEVVPGCAPGTEVNTGSCSAMPAYLPDLPTDPDSMLTYLQKDAVGDNAQARTNNVAKTVWYLVEHLLRPETKAALFKAIAKVPGISVIPDVMDGAGRPGIGITWTFNQASASAGPRGSGSASPVPHGSGSASPVPHGSGSASAMPPNSASASTKPRGGDSASPVPHASGSAGTTSDAIVLVFDKKTFDYLGSSDQAMLTMTVVDAPGQRP